MMLELVLFSSQRCFIHATTHLLVKVPICGEVLAFEFSHTRLLCSFRIKLYWFTPLILSVHSGQWRYRKEYMCGLFNQSMPLWRVTTMVLCKF